MMLQTLGDIVRLMVENDYVGERLDRFLASMQSRISRTVFQKLIKAGNVTINGAPCLDPRHKILKNDKVTVSLPPPVEKNSPPLPEEIPLEILFEDDALLVLNKQPGLVIHPGDGTPSGTMVNALLWYFADSDFSTRFDDATRPGIVHRLDKDTSGCIVVAKTQSALDSLKYSFKKRSVDKTYLAVVVGKMEGKGMLTNNLGRHPVNRKKMAVLNEGGKRAITRYETLSTGIIDGKAISLLKVDIETGRTHQIRVQMSAIGHAVVGDAIYGRNRIIGIERQLLHAWRMTIPHPGTSERMSFEAPFPPDMRSFVESNFQKNPLLPRN